MQKKLLVLGLLAVVVFGIARVAGWATKRKTIVESQRTAVEQVEALNGHYYYDYQLAGVAGDGDSLQDDHPENRHFLSRWLGTDWLHDLFYVTFAQFDGVPEDGAQAAKRDEIGDEQLKFLDDLPGLKWVAVSGTAITDQGVSRLAQMPMIERLWLGQTQLTDVGLSQLGKRSTLTHLSIESTPTSDRGLAFVSRLPRLKFLSLGSPYITGEGLRMLGKTRSLEELYLDRSPVDATVTAALGELKNLRKLSLRATPLNSEALQSLAGLTQLTTLHLDGTLIDDAGLNVAQQWNDLREISLAYTRVSDQGLEELKNCRRLESLQIENTQCTLDGVLSLLHTIQKRPLADALEVAFDVKRNADNGVVSLDLSSVVFRDKDVATLKPLQEIQWLVLSNNELTDSGAEMLVGLGLENLTLLKVPNSKMTDVGLRTLAQLPALRNLEIGKSAITAVAIEEVRRENPGLRISVRDIRSTQP